MIDGQLGENERRFGDRYKSGPAPWQKGGFGNRPSLAKTNLHFAENISNGGPASLSKQTG